MDTDLSQYLGWGLTAVVVSVVVYLMFGGWVAMAIKYFRKVKGKEAR